VGEKKKGCHISYSPTPPFSHLEIFHFSTSLSLFLDFGDGSTIAIDGDDLVVGHEHGSANKPLQLTFTPRRDLSLAKEVKRHARAMEFVSEAQDDTEITPGEPALLKPLGGVS